MQKEPVNLTGFLSVFTDKAAGYRDPKAMKPITGLLFFFSKAANSHAVIVDYALAC